MSEHTDPMWDHIDQHGRTFLVTLRKDGSPTCHPMARFHARGELYLNMYASSAKHRNLTRNPRVCCLVATRSGAERFEAVALSGEAREVPLEETLADDPTPGVRAARSMGMDGVSLERDPQRFQHEDPADLLKRVHVMLERIRSGSRLLWQMPVEQIDFLRESRYR
ncbi:MAG TPA: pyridoxamine 5'-phosphate oxidase family protein [Ilumatobacter sp.]|nr:pyridoxamine 5'-phosphate oxidase family protein [Ilumatobacter sp.]